MAAQTSTTGLRDDWLSIHIFYAGDPDPLLTECVAPLIQRLRDRGLLASYFFIRYWLEGPHIRLRLLPAPDVPAAMLTERAEGALASFLARHPSPDPVVFPAEHYRQTFLTEYDQSTWDDKYGRSGTMPLQANNTYRHDAYEREYARYGGEFGVELAEWHFEVSSDTVLRLVPACRSAKTVQLGLSAQLGMILCTVFLGDDVTEFLAHYRDSWERAYSFDRSTLHTEYDVAYRWMSDRLRHRIDQVRLALESDHDSLWSDWVSHCRRLRDRVQELAVSGRFEFMSAAVTDPGAAMRAVLPSYLHMTNNRLGVNVLEEAYLSHLLRSALLENPRKRAALGS